MYSKRQMFFRQGLHSTSSHSDDGHTKARTSASALHWRMIDVANRDCPGAYQAARPTVASRAPGVLGSGARLPSSPIWKPCVIPLLVSSTYRKWLLAFSARSAG